MIKDNVVIGGCVTTLPNVTVHANSVIAAGNVVTKDVPSETVVKGVPAKPMMTTREYENKRKEFISSRKQKLEIFDQKSFTYCFKISTIMAGVPCKAVKTFMELDADRLVELEVW